MMGRLSFVCLIIFPLFFLSLAAAQNKESTELVTKSALAMIDLPEGATKVNELNVPEHIKLVLKNLFTEINNKPPLSAPKAKYKQGVLEVISYSGYGANKTKSNELIKKIENNLDSVGWNYQQSKPQKVGPITFTLRSVCPGSVKTVGFFVLKGSDLFLVLAEVIPDVTGKWNLDANVNGNYIRVTLELKQTENIVTGTFSSNIGAGTIREIRIKGNSLEALAKIEVQKQLVDIKLEGKIDGDKLSGTLFVEGLPNIAFTAVKI